MADDDLTSSPKAPLPMDRASESVVNPPSIGRVQIVRGPTISSGEIEIPPESFSPIAVSVANPPSSHQPPPLSAGLGGVPTAMGRAQPALPLSTMVGIGLAVFVVLVGLALLLFR
jgi:hypothetical protein